MLFYHVLYLTQKFIWFFHVNEHLILQISLSQLKVLRTASNNPLRPTQGPIELMIQPQTFPQGRIIRNSFGNVSCTVQNNSNGCIRGHLWTSKCTQTIPNSGTFRFFQLLTILNNDVINNLVIKLLPISSLYDLRNLY